MQTKHHLARSLALLWLGMLLAGATGCERIPQVCEDLCKQQARCDPNFDDWGYSIRSCRSDCEDSLEDQLRDVASGCAEAQLDYQQCLAERSCTEVQSYDYSACDRESLRVTQYCTAP